jgi:hypothetical protein
VSSSLYTIGLKFSQRTRIAMNDAELTRIQVDAALRYINKTTEEYKLDIESCRFWHRFPITFRPWPLVRVRTI